MALLKIAGPCLLQGFEDIELARKLKDAGADVFRAKAFVGEGTHPPPKDFPVLDDEGYVEIFDKIASDIMPIATEANEFYFKYHTFQDRLRILRPELFDYVWTPARSMQNYNLLKKLNSPPISNVILKRGFGNTIDEVVGATEYLKNVENLFVCERGIVTFDRRDDSRWEPSFRGILELKQLGYKVFFDASHSVGRREWVVPMAKAALALEIDGLMIEVRESSETSWSDARQTISLKEFEEFVKGIKRQ